MSAGHASVRSLGMHFDNNATPGSEEHERGRRAKALLYEAVNRYLQEFAAPYPGRCVCGAELGGLLGSFVWGIVHGEGSCSACGHPARGIHRVEADGGEIKLTWEMVLPYHPDLVLAPTEGAV